MAIEDKGLGLLIIGVLVALGSAKRKVVPAIAPTPEENAKTHLAQTVEKSKQLERVALEQIQTGGKTPEQLIDEIELKRQQLLNEVVTKTVDPQLVAIHPGMTMAQVEEKTRNIYTKTGADVLLDDIRAQALLQAKLAYVNANRTLEEVEQMPHAALGYSVPGGMWDWYRDHFLTTYEERVALGISP